MLTLHIVCFSAFWLIWQTLMSALNSSSNVPPGYLTRIGSPFKLKREFARQFAVEAMRLSIFPRSVFAMRFSWGFPYVSRLWDVIQSTSWRLRRQCIQTILTIIPHTKVIRKITDIIIKVNRALSNGSPGKFGIFPGIAAVIPTRDL